MQWSKGSAPLLLHPRVRTLTRAWGSGFERWDPDVPVEAPAEAASSPAAPSSRLGA
jgi:hypothetical protein